MLIEQPFPARYELTLLERIERDFDDQAILLLPGGMPVDPQQELSAGPIVRVAPESGRPFLAMFEEGSGISTLVEQILGWPDAYSFCVVRGGTATLVDTRFPRDAATIGIDPVTGIRAVPEHALVLVHCFTTLSCYGAAGLVWESPRLVWDDLRIVTVDADRRVIYARGFNAPMNTDTAFAVDLNTGASQDAPFGWT